MTTPTTPRPAPEAVEAALDYAREMSQMLATTPKWAAACDALYKLRTPDDDSTCETASRILAAEVEYLTCEAGHYKELLESIKNLCEGNGVGLREDVLDILKKM